MITNKTGAKNDRIYNSSKDGSRLKSPEGFLKTLAMYIVKKFKKLEHDIEHDPNGYWSKLNNMKGWGRF